MYADRDEPLQDRLKTDYPMSSTGRVDLFVTDCALDCSEQRLGQLFDGYLEWCGSCVKRLKNVVSDLEAKCKGLSFDGHELMDNSCRTSPTVEEGGQVGLLGDRKG